MDHTGVSRLYFCTMALNVQVADAYARDEERRTVLAGRILEGLGVTGGASKGPADHADIQKIENQISEGTDDSDQGENHVR